MHRKIRSKHYIISAVMMLAGIILSARLLMLTVVDSSKWKGYADNMSVRSVYETAPRGDILDRNGNVLATSRAVYSANISRVEIDDEEAAESFAQLTAFLEDRGEDIDVTDEEFAEALSDTSYESYMPITVSGNISSETAELIEKMELTGVETATNYVREYPYGALASHVIGYLGRISDDEEDEYVDEKGYRSDALIGRDGIEKAYEDILKGEDAVTEFQVNAQGDVVSLLGRTTAEKGEDVQLTIDAELQQTTEEALQQAIEKAASGGTFVSDYGDLSMTYAPNAATGAAVAIDVGTGEILAMASYPDFDPNDFAEGISQEKWASLQKVNENDPLSAYPLYNVASQTAVQPGSTFKPVTALAALSCGLDVGQSLYDEGSIELGGTTYGCYLWNDTGATHGYVNLYEAMKASCNYYFYDIASGFDFASDEELDYDEEITNELILSYASALGLGEKTGIEINESSGTIPSAELKEEETKNSLRNYLLAESETYFEAESLTDRKQTAKNIEKIVKWADKGLTLEEIIGKLKKETYVRKDMASELASVCYYTYFNQMQWNQADTFNIAIGQGDNAYTTLQMANYMAALANGGINNGATLIVGNGSASDTDEKSRLDEEDVETVLEAMSSVTSDTDGSLYSVFFGFPYSVAAKTGTAQRAGKIPVDDEKEYLREHLHLIAPGITMSQVEAEAERLMDAYPDIYGSESSALRRAVINLGGDGMTSDDIDRYKDSYDNFAWTVALAPADDPQIAVAVMIVQGGTSSNAAPVVREIIGRYGEISQWEESF